MRRERLALGACPSYAHSGLETEAFNAFGSSEALTFANSRPSSVSPSASGERSRGDGPAPVDDSPVIL